MGWFDSIREEPLIWLFSILSIIVLVAIGITANRTAISHGEDSLFDEEWEEEEDWEEMKTKRMKTTITMKIIDFQIVALLNQ